MSSPLLRRAGAAIGASPAPAPGARDASSSSSPAARGQPLHRRRRVEPDRSAGREERSLSPTAASPAATPTPAVRRLHHSGGSAFPLTARGRRASQQESHPPSPTRASVDACARDDPLNSLPAGAKNPGILGIIRVRIWRKTFDCPRNRNGARAQLAAEPPGRTGLARWLSRPPRRNETRTGCACCDPHHVRS